MVIFVSDFVFAFLHFCFPMVFLDIDQVSVLNVDVNITCRYKNQGSLSGGFEINAGLIGHVHLNEVGTSFFLPNMLLFVFSMVKPLLHILIMHINFG